MARPTNAVRLRDLTPQSVGDDVYRLVQDHVTSLLLALDPSAVWKTSPETSTLRWDTQLLVGYAQKGLPATDWPDHGCALDALQSVCAALYSQAGDPGTFGVGALETEADPDSAIGVVLLAAHARQRISPRYAREPVPVRELAALAGVDPGHVRLLARQGELAVEDGHVRPAEARRWLSGRGVEGFAAEN
jgi:hypothetical protein